MCRECGCECGCWPHHHTEGRVMRRRFLTKAEKAERLSSYAEELRKELAAVEERVKELGSQ